MRICIRDYRFLAAIVLAVLLAPVSAAPHIPGFDTALARSQERLGGPLHLSGRRDGAARLKLYADEVEFYRRRNRLVATGNVLLWEPDHQIAAERADFDAVTQLGTFYNASGFAALGKLADVSQFGTLQPDVQFYGETIEKIGRRNLHHLAWRLHLVRAGQPAMGNDVGLHPAPRRSLRAAEEHAAEGERDPGAVPAGALLSRSATTTARPAS